LKIYLGKCNVTKPTDYECLW